MAVASVRSTLRAVVWPAALSAAIVDFAMDLMFRNSTLNVATFAVVFVLVAAKRYRDCRRDHAFQQRVAVRRERLIAEKRRHCEALGLDEPATLRALRRCDFDRAAVWELVLSGMRSADSPAPASK